MLFVKLLGPLKLTMNNIPVQTDLGTSGRSLAGYLFSNPGKCHRRERLASMFWPKADEHHARGAMNSAIWRLRKAVARSSENSEREVFVTNGEEVQFNPASWIEIDKPSFEGTLKKFMQQPSLLLKSDGRSELENSLRENNCTLLEADDSDWVLSEREILNELRTRASRLLARYCILSSEYERASDITRKLLDVDLFKEGILREHIVALTLSGQRPDAIRYYLKWSKMLYDELGVAPMPQTKSLFERIKAIETLEELSAIRADACLGEKIISEELH